VVLRGLGGQGKTQISLEYCRRVKTQVRMIFWIDASSESTTKQSIESIAQHIKGPEDKLQDGMIVSFVLNTLGEWTDAWLLVFDNYDDPKAFPNLQDFIPTGEHGYILITTRHSDTDSLADPENVIELPGLPEEDALKLLLKQSGMNLADTSWTGEGKDIVNRLGCHALAIAQAGSYIRMQKIPLNQFLAHYNLQRQRTIVLQQRVQMSQYRRKSNQAAAETEMNVFSTWELSFQQLLRDDIMGQQNADILTLFAFFDSQDISEDLFKTFCEYGKKGRGLSGSWGSLAPFMNDNGDWDHEKFVLSLIDLAGLSLIDNWSRENDNWIRLRTSPKTRREKSILAAKVLGNVIYAKTRNGGISLSLIERQTLNSHVDSYRENIDFFDLDVSDRSLKSGYNHIERWDRVIANFLDINGRWEEAEEFQRRILLWQEEKYGKENECTMVAASNLAAALANQAKYAEAEDIFKVVLDFHENLYGAEDEMTLKTMRSLAMVYRDKGHFKAAETMQRRQVEICKRTLGLEKSHTLRSFAILGDILFSRGKYKEAEELLRHAVQKQEGPEDQFSISTMMELPKALAMALAFQGGEKCLEGERMLRRALNCHKKELESHLPVAIDELACYGETLRRLGRYTKAEEVLRKVIKSNEKAIGSAKRNALSGVAALGNTLLDQRKYEEAEIAIDRATKGLEKLLGTDHPHTLECILGLAVLREGQGRYEEALTLYRRVHSGLKKELAEDHPDVIRAAKGCSDMFGKITDSASEYQSQLAKQEKVLSD
jgi:tetratricopeptide (TPR) repeat protein